MTDRYNPHCPLKHIYTQVQVYAVVVVIVVALMFNDMDDIQMTPIRVKMNVSFPQERFKGVYGLKERCTCRYVTIKVSKSRPCQLQWKK